MLLSDHLFGTGHLPLHFEFFANLENFFDIGVWVLLWVQLLLPVPVLVVLAHILDSRQYLQLFSDRLCLLTVDLFHVLLLRLDLLLPLDDLAHKGRHFAILWQLLQLGALFDPFEGLLRV